MIRAITRFNRAKSGETHMKIHWNNILFIMTATATGAAAHNWASMGDDFFLPYLSGFANCLLWVYWFGLRR